MKKIFLLSSFLLLLSLSGVQAASTQAERLKGVIESALDVVYGEKSSELSPEEKQDKVREVLESEYKIDVIIRRAIGRNWRLMDSKEQEKVLDMVKKLIVKAYVSGMQRNGRPEIEMGETISITDKRREIHSKVKMDDETVNVTYRLGKMSSGWQIYDIVVEDISVVSNYRQQINDHFRKGDAQGLINKLEKLLTKEDIDEEIQL